MDVFVLEFSNEENNPNKPQMLRYSFQILANNSKEANEILKESLPKLYDEFKFKGSYKERVFNFFHRNQ